MQTPRTPNPRRYNQVLGIKSEGRKRYRRMSQLHIAPGDPVRRILFPSNQPDDMNRPLDEVFPNLVITSQFPHHFEPSLSSPR